MKNSEYNKIFFLLFVNIRVFHMCVSHLEGRLKIVDFVARCLDMALSVVFGVFGGCGDGDWRR